ncbi:radical S-adenosyl methionine domain-containing protein 1, mitochondrial-like isoform X2 [Dreissena polymorpha]|uniref:radical S-adenosyl methionine domain-containing protein 1, mitochondrial-like isoform X2 n=1 Tax=Dreissena polymorpha TaxID=45954 RepID=UPI002264BC91|nr:radical S-adenosyl methionine domain-containing protein 1, mitochondrial-like isoform X2 [Dreissena polymorpha]
MLRLIRKHISIGGGIGPSWLRISARQALQVCKLSTSAEPTQQSNVNEASLYVHWPYCARRCTYCNFNKYIRRKEDTERMTACLTRELKTLIELSGVSKIKTVFFGGGTPSLAPPSSIQTILDTLKAGDLLIPAAEVSLEANPTHLETSRLRGFRDAGVNRLSIGVQTLCDTDLKTLGRDHTVAESLRCVEEAKQLFPGQVSVDVMFGRPSQKLKDWQTEIKQIADLCVNHVSLYQLTLERGTRLHKLVEQGMISTPDGDTLADMYLAALEGYESQHNQAYWQCKQYIGIGPGANGRFSRETDSSVREARIQTLEPDNWMFEVEKYGHATRKVTQLSTKDRLEEFLCQGLRTREGITHKDWLLLSPPLDLVNLFQSNKRLTNILDMGYLVIDQQGLRATPSGILVLDSVLPYLLVALSDVMEVHKTSVA